MLSLVLPLLPAMLRAVLICCSCAAVKGAEVWLATLVSNSFTRSKSLYTIVLRLVISALVCGSAPEFIGGKCLMVWLLELGLRVDGKDRYLLESSSRAKLLHAYVAGIGEHDKRWAG